MATQTTEDDFCPICMDTPVVAKVLHICKHIFCQSCIDDSFAKLQPRCPVCGVIYGEIKGTQPPGQMNVNVDLHTVLPGFEGCGTIVINYDFPSGTQTDRHPNPGVAFSGTRRVAYLPNNKEGNKVLSLLRKAFESKVVFRIGQSATTGQDNTVIWNDIHHKTTLHGGQYNFGFPDPTYLNRVTQELAAHGITE